MHWVPAHSRAPWGQFQTWLFPFFREPTKHAYYMAHLRSVNANLYKESLNFQENSYQTGQGVAMTNSSQHVLLKEMHWMKGS